MLSVVLQRYMQRWNILHFPVQMRSQNEFLPSNWSEPLTLPLDDGCDGFRPNATDSSNNGKIRHTVFIFPISVCDYTYQYREWLNYWFDISGFWLIILEYTLDSGVLQMNLLFNVICYSSYSIAIFGERWYNYQAVRVGVQWEPTQKQWEHFEKNTAKTRREVSIRLVNMVYAPDTI